MCRCHILSLDCHPIPRIFFEKKIKEHDIDSTSIHVGMRHKHTNSETKTKMAASSVTGAGKKKHRSITLINHSRTCSSARENIGRTAPRRAEPPFAHYSYYTFRPRRFILCGMSKDISFYMQKTPGNDGNESVRVSSSSRFCLFIGVIIFFLCLWRNKCDGG